MASKYDSVTKDLRRVTTAELSDDNGRQAKVDEIKADLRVAYPDETKSPNGLAILYKSVRDSIDAAEELLSGLSLKKDALSQMIADSFENNGLSSLKLADGSSITIQPEPYTAVKDPAALRAWARRNNLEESLSLPWQTVNALSKASLLAGEGLPDGVEVFLKTDKVVLRKK